MLLSYQIIVAMMVMMRRYAWRHNVRLGLAQLLLMLQQRGATYANANAHTDPNTYTHRIGLRGGSFIVSQGCCWWHLMPGGLQIPWITASATGRGSCGNRWLREAAMMPNDCCLSVLCDGRVTVHILDFAAVVVGDNRVTC